MAQKFVPEEQTLIAADANIVRQDLNLSDPSTIKGSQGVDPELDKKATENVAQLISFAADDHQAQARSKAAIEEFGLELQRKTAQQSSMLKRPVKEMSKRSDEGGEVVNALVDLKMTVEDLDPAKFDFSAGWFSRLMGHLPGIGTPLKRYFSRFETSQTIINAVIKSLEKGREQLKRDNITLSEDQKKMRDLTLRIEKAIKLAQIMDAKLGYHAERELSGDEAKVKFINEELLFPLRQRIVDLQQQLAVAQQGIIAIEVIMRNNNELVRGVNRALNVTVSALEVAVTVAVALNDQKIVLDKIDALNATTNELIRGTAARLKTQGVEIHKRAAGSQIDMEALRAAFTDIRAAMEDLSRFRTDALPKMASTILEMDKVTEETEQTIQKLEKGNRVKPSFHLDVD
jgi:uncharacterized protein YaaN involved in tellurite resistance